MSINHLRNEEVSKHGFIVLFIDGNIPLGIICKEIWATTPNY